MMNTDELFDPAATDNALLARLPKLLLRRPVLEACLGSWASMTVIRGPQGYGKTTLVVSWLERLTVPNLIRVWVNAGPDLNDRERFWRHVLRCFHPGPEQQVPDTAGALRALEARLRSVPGYRVALVIDRFDGIQDPHVIDDLAELAQRQRNLHLYVCTRGGHLLETVGSARTDLVTIGPADLLFSAAEIRLLAGVLGRPVTDEEVAAVHRATGGWVAPSRRILEASPSGRLDLTLAQDYLRSTVLPHLGDRETLRGLMQLCLVERPPIRMIHELCEAPHALAAALDGLGLPVLDGWREDSHLRLPSLLRTVLRDEFRRLEPESARAFHRRVGTWFAARTRATGADSTADAADASDAAAAADADADGNAVEALRHLTMAGAWDDLVQLWTTAGSRLLASRPDEAGRILAAVPEHVLHRRPRLMVGQALVTALAASAPGDLAPALGAYAATSEQIIRTSADILPLPDLLSVGAGYLYGQRTRGRFEAAERFAADLHDRITRERAGEAMPDGDLACFLVQRGLTHTLRGNHPAAIRCYRLAWEHGRRAADRLAGLSAAANLAMTYAIRGQREQALRWLDRHREVDTRGGQWSHGLAGLGAGIARAALALDELDPSRASAELDRLDPPSADLELWPFVAYLEAVHGLHHGEPALALTSLTQTMTGHDATLTGQGAPLRLHCRAGADLLMACGEGNRARQLLGRAVGDGDALSVSAARLDLLSGDHDAAGALATRALCAPECWERDGLELLLIKAVIALRRDDPGTAGRLFAHAVGRYRRTRVLRAFATIPSDDLSALVGLTTDLLSPAEAAMLTGVRPVFTAPVRLVHLTRQEQRVLVQLDRAQSNKDIADALYVSVSTVKTQLHAIYRKLGTASRKETIARAHELALLPHPPGAGS